jgi:hypothetical protein
MLPSGEMDWIMATYVEMQHLFCFHDEPYNLNLEREQTEDTSYATFQIPTHAVRPIHAQRISK